jgi:transposase
MKPYSQDLRERVIAGVDEAQQSQAKIAETFKVSCSTVEKWWQRQRETGSCAALPHGGGQARALRDCADFIRTRLQQQPDLTLEELCIRVADATGVKVSPSMMCRELQRLRLPRKKSHSMIVNGRRPA